MVDTSSNDRPRSVVHAYTDGGTAPRNPGPGGWGVVLQYGSHTKELCGGTADDTTNIVMEMTAAAEALEALSRPCEVHVFTDSRFVIDGITKWVDGWAKRGWVKRDGSPVQNPELWQRIQLAVRCHESVVWHWVKGHSGNPGNERADALVAQGRRGAVEKAREVLNV
ncbi:ribonuclease HI [Mycolicibacterium mageritense]|uniref:ribonuclease H n=1 Tax=Mycolicibacterium mageritense TaxID=53462 RepID=A0ABM7HSV5_MYCME|nr:ribonuclease HI [Mycolicibacterium mageritense]BBX33636.1 ribonuclease H [Mycolicibacterium mageritense]CDO22065.1 ribonuclease H [Mycolicibacterium mageritense DSM 44476 = CIP 104973]